MSESWARAMLLAYDAYQKTGKRHRVHGYFVEGVGWAYTIDRARRPPHVKKPEPIVMTEDLFRSLSETLPRCAQRARSFHGGRSKMAITDRQVAAAMAQFSRQNFYECDLPAPAIGPHWHLVTSKNKKRTWPR